MKTIVIDGNEYDIECNALTYIQYKKVFNKGIFADMDIIKDYLIRQTLKANELKEKYPQMSEQEIDTQVGNYMNNYIDDFIEVITRIAYILIYSANEKIEEYENWLRKIKSFKIDDDWVAEVTELAVDCFC
mgnify:FL=1|jgi:hypothetical protein|nr:MAG TPA: tail assembly chaperone protein [Caudoviricetes sp.]